MILKGTKQNIDMMGGKASSTREGRKVNFFTEFFYNTFSIFESLSNNRNRSTIFSFMYLVILSCFVFTNVNLFQDFVLFFVFAYSLFYVLFIEEVTARESAYLLSEFISYTTSLIVSILAVFSLAYIVNYVVANETKKIEQNAENINGK